MLCDAKVTSEKAKTADDDGDAEDGTEESTEKLVDWAVAFEKEVEEEEANAGNRERNNKGFEGVLLCTPDRKRE